MLEGLLALVETHPAPEIAVSLITLAVTRLWDAWRRQKEHAAEGDVAIKLNDREELARVREEMRDDLEKMRTRYDKLREEHAELLAKFNELKTEIAELRRNQDKRLRRERGPRKP
jgi:chromosome segregation ATPase